MKFRFLTAICACFGMLGFSVTSAQNAPDEALRYMARGEEAVALAKSASDYEDAVREFEKAVTLAPDWPAAHYNLGLVQEQAGKTEAAITSLRRYLLLAPEAEDAQQVRQLVDRLEYRMERARKESDRLAPILGSWLFYIPEQGKLTDQEHIFTAKNGEISLSIPGLLGKSPVPVVFDGENVRFRYVMKNPSMDTEYEFVGRMVSPTRLRGEFKHLVLRSNLPVTPTGKSGSALVEYWRK